MRRFHLNRVTDETGISGTGRVAEGVVFANGWCSMVWLTAHTSCAFYTSIAEVRAIHGHGGKTEIIWDELCCLHCKHPIDDHWSDNCGGCMYGMNDKTIPSCDCVLMGHNERIPVEVRARCLALDVLEDLAKFTNNLGVQMGGLSSEPNSRKREDQARALFERWNISSPRIREAIDALRRAESLDGGR